MDLRGADRGVLYWVTSVMFRNSGSVVFMVAPRIYGERTEAPIHSLCTASPVFQTMLQVLTDQHTKLGIKETVPRCFCPPIKRIL
jgi:hypothetical protein